MDGILVPNTEFGHVEIRGKDAEKRASELAGDEHDLSWRNGPGASMSTLSTWRCCCHPR